jgi:hypothetical protein
VLGGVALGPAKHARKGKRDSKAIEQRTAGARSVAPKGVRRLTGPGAGIPAEYMPLEEIFTPANRKKMMAGVKDAMRTLREEGKKQWAAKGVGKQEKNRKSTPTRKSRIGSGSKPANTGRGGTRQKQR